MNSWELSNRYKSNLNRVFGFGEWKMRNGERVVVDLMGDGFIAGKIPTIGFGEPVRLSWSIKGKSHQCDAFDLMEL